MKSSPKSVLAFMLSLVLVSALYFIVVRRAGRTRSDLEPPPQPLTIQYTTAELPLEPTAQWWEGIEPVTIHLYPQALMPPYGTEERDVVVRGAFNDREAAFLLEFRDETENRGSTVPPDGCAIMLALLGSPATVQMMGHADQANIWHWTADRDSATVPVRELFASGPGTQSPLPGQHVQGQARYRDGTWLVVLKRPLASQQDGELALSSGADRQISFAVWDGAAMERLSKKSVAVLRPLSLEQD